MSSTPPPVAGWNLALRFGLEMAALAGFAVAAWQLASGPARWIVAIAAVAVAAGVWGTFNVPHDPSRSGAAPVVVPGWLRLVIEALVLLGGATGFALAGFPLVALIMAVLVVAHYAASTARIKWLLASS